MWMQGKTLSIVLPTSGKPAALQAIKPGVKSFLRITGHFEIQCSIFPNRNTEQKGVNMNRNKYNKKSNQI